MGTLIQDLRYGFRLLLKHPGFTLVAVITLALGIGANSAIFSVVNAVLLRPLPYRDSERLVMINHDYPQLQLRASVSAYGYRHYRDRAGSFENLTAFSGRSFSLTGRGEPERLAAMAVTPSFLSTLGAAPAQGRDFLPEEDQPGQNQVVVLSHGLWQRRFGGDGALLGQTITLDGEVYTVVGIMPAHFQFGREIGSNVDLWTPAVFTPEQLSPDRLTWEFLQVIGRLKPDVSYREAQAELDLIADNLRGEYMPEADRSNWGLVLEPLQERLVGELRPALWMLLGAVGFVLLIACANVANLLLARAGARQKEIAIRKAIGASRWRILRQLLAESVLLSLLGGGVGLLFAFWGVGLLAGFEQIHIPRAHEIGLDGSVLVFTTVVSLLTGVLSGLAPGLQRSAVHLQETLKEGGRTGSAGARQGLRSALVTFETALALVLLIGAGLLIKSFQRLQDVDPGFRAGNVLSMHLALPESKYREPQELDNFYKQLLEEVRGLPGVESAGAISTLPLSGFGSSGSFQIEGRVLPPGESSPHGARWRATPGYFETLRIPLLRGRFFTDEDTAESPGVVIIDENLARKYWPGEDPLGKRLGFEGGLDSPRWREIVGIVGHVKHEALEGESRAQYYIPQSQSPQRHLFLVARSSGDPASLTGAVRGSIRKLDPDLPAALVRSMEQMVSDSLARRRFSTLLLGIFAFIALGLAAVGIYGLTSYSVSQRTHEVGIRMALGAGKGEILAMVVRQGMVFTVAGVVIGLAGALGLTRFLSGLLFGVQPTDPLTFLTVSLFLLAVALLACLIPARRATRLDPMAALRYE